MGNGKRTFSRHFRQTLAIIVVTSLVAGPLIASASAASSEQEPIATQSQSQNLSTGSARALTWRKSGGFVKIVSSRSIQNSITGAPLVTNGVTYTYLTRHKAPKLQRFLQGDGRERWYAMAGAGSSAVILLPGAVIEAEGLRLQKRAKIGSVQLGLSRDIGDGRVTLGYLRNISQRDRLVPYYTRKTRQNLAALTLTFKH